MKRLIIILTAIFALCSCEHDIARKMDFNIILNPENTYYTGEPVKFDFKGEIDNLILYVGETPHYIKTVEEKLSGYEYTWDKSGTYEVTFIGSNSNYQSHEDFIKKITVTIIDKF